LTTTSQSHSNGQNSKQSSLDAYEGRFQKPVMMPKAAGPHERCIGFPKPWRRCHHTPIILARWLEVFRRAAQAILRHGGCSKAKARSQREGSAQAEA
jgi:hypothetical protein